VDPIYALRKAVLQLQVDNASIAVPTASANGGERASLAAKEGCCRVLYNNGVLLVLRQAASGCECTDGGVAPRLGVQVTHP